jgi:Sulfotransferase family
LIIGNERYRRVRKGLGPEHFTRERFFEPTPHETSFLPARLIPEGVKGYSIWPENEAELRRKWNSPDLAYVGDKAPFYIRQLPHLRDAFPGCKLVVLLRDPVSVADSYVRRAENPDDHWPSENDHTVAIEHWNQSIEDLNNYLVRFGLQDLFIVDYHTFYSGDQTYLRSLYRFLELETSQFVERQFVEATRNSDRRSARRLPAAGATHPVDARLPGLGCRPGEPLRSRDASRCSPSRLPTLVRHEPRITRRGQVLRR